MTNELSLKNEDLRNKIRTLYLEGKNIKQIQDILKIPCGTWDNAFYLNHNGFRDYIIEVKKQEMLQGAEEISREIRNIQAGDNAKLLEIKRKESEFLRETVGKDLGYSKRIETFGLNLNKTEPLDEDQKAKLDKLFKTSSNTKSKDVDYVVVDNSVDSVDNITQQ